MTPTNFRSAAVAILALGAALPASAAFAQADLFAAPLFGAASAPVVGSAPAVVYVDEAPVPPAIKGHFTCAFNEVHTRMERRACSGTHYGYPRAID